jgi:uncharacterized protein YhjY with autotransporter beta-barrel domain
MIVQPVASCRSSVRSGPTAWVARMLFLLVFACAGWSSQALATIGCEIQPSGVTTQSGPAGSTLNYSFTIVDLSGGCATTVNGTITPGPDTTGGAIAAPLTWSGAPGATITFSVTLGPNGGGNASFTATCPNTDCFNGNTTIAYAAATQNIHVFSAASPTSVTNNQLATSTFSANLQTNGAPGTYNIQFTNITTAAALGTVTPNPAGTASVTINNFTAGTFTIRATVVCPVLAPDPACPGIPPVNFTLVVQPTGVTPVTPASTTTTGGTPVTLTSYYGSASVPASNGSNMTFTITQAPGGNGTVNGLATTGVGTTAGNASVVFLATVPGTYTINANSGCTFCTPGSTNFTVVISAITRTLTVVSGNGQSAPTNTALPAPLVVLAQDNAVNAPGITINWAASGGATLSAPTSVTNGAGQAQITLTLGAAPGPVTVTGTRADDGTAIATFTANGTLTRTLTLVSGNNQAGAPGATLAAPLTVEARNNGVLAAGIGINFTVTSGSATMAPPNATTNATGTAGSSATLGAVPGTVVVRAARQDDLTVFVDFTVSAGKLAALPGLTKPAQAVAIAIDTFCPALGNGPLADPNANDLRVRCNELISAIGTDPAGVRAALEELYADVALVQSSSGLLAAQAQFDNIKARIAALRSGTRGVSFGGLAMSNGRASAPIGSLVDTLLADGGNQEPGAEFERWGFFASGTIGRGDADRGAINPAYDFDIKGLTAGIDYRYSDQWIVGGTVGYTRQDNSLTGAEGELKTQGWSISGYTTYYQANSWYSDAVLSYGRNDYEMQRRLRYAFTLPGSLTTTVDQRSHADSSGTSLTFAGSVGRDFSRGAWGFGPYARFMYTKLDFDATTEQMTPGSPGSGLALVIQTRDVTSVSSVLGGKLTYARSTNWGVLMPHLQAEWQHEFKDDPSAVEAHFLYDPTATPFTITGDELDTDFFRIGLGLSMVLTKGRSGFFYYEKLIGRDGISQDNLALGLRIEF